MRLIWKGNLTWVIKTVHRSFKFYGVTFRWFGIGFIVGKKETKSTEAPDG